MSPTTKSAWEVFCLYIIPVGGGIPAGVVLAKARGLHWTVMMVLYFLSDVLLAVVFEPIMLFVIARGKKSAKVALFLENLKQAVKRTTPQFGTTLRPLGLIAVSFGVDPMTGRAVAKAAGHGFLSGWLIAITGDMIYFTVLMVSTLWLNHILGDGTLTTIIILVLMFLVPSLVRKFRERGKPAN